MLVTKKEAQEENLPAGVIDNLSVDNLIFSVQDGQLNILLAQYKYGLAANQWGLIGHWVKSDENLVTAAERILKHTTGVKNFHLDQLATFGDVNRYPPRRIITIAYYSLVRFEEAKVVIPEHVIDVRWFNVHELPTLIFDHQNIVDTCLAQLKYKVRHEPIGFSLLPEKFTLLQLQEIYEAILDVKLDKPNFRRKILKMNLLINCNEKQHDVAHRAANLYRFDIHVYEKLSEFGFNFEY